MSKTYAVTFAPVSMTLDEAFASLKAPLRRLSAVYTGRCFELRLNAAGSGYRFSGDERQAPTPLAAVEGTPTWQGVSAYYMTPAGALHVAALGVKGETGTMFAFLPDSGWVTQQQYDPAAFEEFLSAVTESATRIGAGYWVYELDPSLAFLTQGALPARLRGEIAYPEGSVVAVAATAAVIPFTAFESILAPAFHIQREGEYAVAKAKGFPQQEED